MPKSSAERVLLHRLRFQALNARQQGCSLVIPCIAGFSHGDVCVKLFCERSMNSRYRHEEAPVTTSSRTGATLIRKGDKCGEFSRHSQVSQATPPVYDGT
jgi:hypothetical protein